VNPVRDASIDSAAHRRGEGKARHTAVRSASLGRALQHAPAAPKVCDFTDLRGF
jgi:hypothetical protein